LEFKAADIEVKSPTVNNIEIAGTKSLQMTPEPNHFKYQLCTTSTKEFLKKTPAPQKIIFVSEKIIKEHPY